MAAARLWVRWSWRDLRERWLLVSAIAFVIAIGTGLAAGLGSIESWRVRSLDRSTALLAAHDLRLSLGEGSFASRGRLAGAARSIPHVEWIDAAEERLVTDSQLDASTGSRTVLTPGRIVGVDVKSGPVVDRVDIEAGRGLAAGDDGKAVAVLEATYADEHSVAPGATIRVAGGRMLRVVGAGRSPETFFIVPPGTTLATPGSYGILFAPLATAQALTGRRGAVNELVLTLTSGSDAALVEAELTRAVRASLPRVGVTITRAEDEALQRAYDDSTNDQQLMNVLALFVLVGASLAAFNLVGRVIEAQRRQIGIGMALGASPSRLALRPLLLAAEVALLGVVFGIGVGVLIGWAYGLALREFFPLPVIETPIQFGAFFRAAAIGFALPFAAAAYPVWRGIRMKPIEAIEIGFRAGKGSGLAPLLRRIPLPGRTLAEMPIRDTLRTPRRTLMTVIGLAAVVAVVVTFFGLIDSFGAMIDRTQAEALRGNRSRMSVELDRFYERSSPQVSGITASPTIGRAETTIRLPSTLVEGDAEVDVWLELVDPASKLWQPSISKGSFAPHASGIVITEKAADDLGVGVGDRLVLRHQRRTGPTTFETVETPLEVDGLHPNPLRFYAYMDTGRAKLMGLTGTANALSVTPAAGVSQDQVARALFGRPGVASVQAVTAATDALEDYIQDFNVIIQVAALVVMLLALLIAFNSTSINADERAREHATMFAFGLPVRSVVAISIVESLIKGILATLLGIALGLGLIGWIFYASLPEVLPEVGGSVTLSSATYTAAVLVGVIASALAPVLTVRRLRRMNVPAALRVLE